MVNLGSSKMPKDGSERAGLRNQGRGGERFAPAAAYNELETRPG